MNNKWNNNGECRVYLTPEQWDKVLDLLVDENFSGADKELTEIENRLLTQVPELGWKHEPVR